MPIHPRIPRPHSGVVWQLHWQTDQTVRQNVSDVKDAEQLLKDNSIDYSMEDVPQENTLLTVVMPFMLSIVVVVVIIIMV